MTVPYLLVSVIILVLVLLLIARAVRHRRQRREERWGMQDIVSSPPRSVSKGLGESTRPAAASYSPEPSSRSGAGGQAGAFGGFDDETQGRRKDEGQETELERAIRLANYDDRAGSARSGGAGKRLVSNDENKVRSEAEEQKTRLIREAQEREALFKLLWSDRGGIGSSGIGRRGVGGDTSSLPEPSKQINIQPPPPPSSSQKAKKESSKKQETKKKLSSKQEAKILQASAGETHRRTALAVAQRKTKSPKAVSDTVDCTVFAPPTVPMRDSFMIQVFAHLPEQAAEAQTLAQRFDGEALARGFMNLEVEVERGSKLVFHLVMPGLEIDEPLQTLVWRGSPASVQFGGTVMKGHPGGNVIGTVTISQDGIPVGHIKFKLTVTAHKQSFERKLRPAGDVARHYERAFVSYASQDRDEVLKRVQMLARLGINYFQDVLTLEPGQRWERELYRHIDESDLFLLFWSSAAQQSQWVHREVQYAIARKGNDELAPPEIVPIPIEGPPLAEPPPELAHLHFNDYLLYFMAQKN